jgi:membrane protein DedA with SNARE-associated domain
MIFSFSQIIQWLIHYKYFALFPIMVFEGPIITVIGGFLSSLGYLNIFLVYTTVVLGDLVGDSIYYALGYWGRNQFVEKWGRYVGVTAERVKRLEHHFEKNGGKTLILGKLTHAVGTAILLAAGVAKMPYGKFIWYNFVPTLPKSLILLLIGFYFGQSYAEFSKYLSYTAFVTIATAILLTVIYIIMIKIGKKYTE